MEKTARIKCYWERNSNISNNVENGGFSQNGTGGTKGKSSKWLIFGRNFERQKEYLGNSSRMIA